MSGPALCQTIHVADGRPRMLGDHAALLADAARALFGRNWSPDPRELERRIAALLREERVPRGVSAFVRLELPPEGEERLLPAGRSLYDGYALRSLRPEAVPFPCDIPFGPLPTTLCEEADRLADLQARRIARGGVALCLDEEERCLRAGGGTLFAIRGRTLLTAPAADAPTLFRGYLHARTGGDAPAAPAFPAVERTLLLRAAPAARLEPREEAFTLEELPQMDELLYADHRGITSISRVGDTLYLPILAERLAAAVERLFPKK